MTSVKFLNGELAKLLVEWRKKKGLDTIKDAAWFLGTSPEVLSGLESGKRQYMDAPIIEGILHAYGAEQYIIDDAKAKARQIRFGDPQKWQESGPSWLNRFTQLEPHATALDIYEDVYITGICQTSAYSRAVFEAFGLLNEEQTNTALEFRAHRRRTMIEAHGKEARIRLIQAEHSLRMIEKTDLYGPQLERLHEDNGREHVEVFILPTGILHPSMDGPYMVLSFEDAETPDVVYQEGVLGAQYAATKDDVSRCRGVFSATLAPAVPLEEWSS